MKKRFLSIAVFLSVVALSTFLIPKDNSKDIDQATLVASSISWGSRGDDVKKIQTKLKNWGYFNGKVDGVYGEDTYRGIIKFQQKHGIKQDGVVGGVTASKLGIDLNTSAAATSNSLNRSSDEYLLARAIHGEARGEPYVGKVAVGAIILNRVNLSEFPNTIAGVIYQPLAFTAVADGQINLEPDAESLKAARDALNGWDPTSGCSYYWNPATATSKWIWSRKVMLKIGKHWFGV